MLLTLALQSGTLVSKVSQVPEHTAGVRSGHDQISDLHAITSTG